MNDNSECGCETQFVIDNHKHLCIETPPYHFGDHICECGKKWANE